MSIDPHIVACPKCRAAAEQPCVGTRGQIRVSSHRERWNAANRANPPSNRTPKHVTKIAHQSCVWCKRVQHQPHLENCPELTGVQSKTDYVSWMKAKRRTGAYLRRPRDNHSILPHTLYLAETMVEQDTPAGLYHEDVP